MEQVSSDFSQIEDVVSSDKLLLLLFISLKSN